MAFTEEQYARVRPYLYHLTSRDNFESLRRTNLLQSAASLLNQASRSSMVNHLRKGSLVLRIDGQTVLMRDQQPLHEGNIKFVDGWRFDQLIEYLNRHAFFWSGTASKVIDYGERHFERYAAERSVILRAPFLSVLKANTPRHPLFCKYNSGSPRMVNGQKSPRGPDTFLRAQLCSFNPGEVVEVVYRDSVVLPGDTEWAQTPKGPWVHLGDSQLSVHAALR
jgi:hypothetical protein